MKLKIALLAVLLMPVGCKTNTASTPPAALAPGYSSSFDQQAGQALASARALVSQAREDYSNLTPEQQAQEKTVLNNFILSVNIADNLYLTYHAGGATVTQAQVQTALDQVTSTQASYTAVSGVK